LKIEDWKVKSEKLIVLFLLMAVLAGCSTQKNTWTSRTFHEMKVVHNIFHNGDVAFIEGQKAIINANEDNYTDIINLYPVSNHKAAEASTSQMDVTIEKCRKSIKLHSIKAKPKPNPKKKNNPKYKAWLAQEEFNSQIARTWIRLGEAEFHKGDFLGSVGTFQYIIKHYSYDPDMVAQCQLWIARAYGELGWMYEAEEMLAKVKIDDLKRKHAALYSAVNADVHIKSGLYHEAIPFVKLAMPEEKRTVNRPRFAYVLAQLYEREGKTDEAITYYSKAIRMTPPVVMDFNARLRRAELKGKSSMKQLKMMLKQSKYKNNLDQIYGVMANISLHEGDTAQALEYYALAIENAKDAGLTKAAILIDAADLLYDRREYADAQPYYREAVTILPAEHKDYARISQRSETLDLLIREYNTIELQDSLQALSRLPEDRQRAICERIVAELIENEKQAEEDAKQAQRDQELEDDGPLSVDTRNMIGGPQSTDWYFYNPQLIRSGKQEFQRRWGNRRLEDNWRRLSKSVLTLPTAANADEEIQMDTDSLTTDSVAIAAVKPVIETDDHKPEYYMQQIPKTPEDLHMSDSLIADALYNLIYIYKDQLGDEALSRATFDEFCHRFPTDSRLLDLYYMQYLTALRDSDEATMDLYRRQLQTHYPDSKQTQIVSDPTYFDKLRRMANEQDSLYEQTYNAFADNRFSEVKSLKQYAEQEYPFSPLMPRFQFLNAVAVARTDGQEAFISELQQMVDRYPDNELSAMAKDFLAMMNQGMESQKGDIKSDLDELRTTTTEDEPQAEATETVIDRNSPSVVLFVLDKADEQTLNKVLYQVALFNFTQFLIRDFELRPMPVYQTGAALRVSGFERMDEAEWYIGLTEQNAELQAELSKLNVTSVIAMTEQELK
jgi:tetratricopeptide (TPR) repeat protein